MTNIKGKRICTRIILPLLFFILLYSTINWVNAETEYECRLWTWTPGPIMSLEGNAIPSIKLLPSRPSIYIFAIPVARKTAFEAGDPCLRIISPGLKVASYLFSLTSLISFSERFFKFFHETMQFSQLLTNFSLDITCQNKRVTKLVFRVASYEFLTYITSNIDIYHQNLLYLSI